MPPPLCTKQPPAEALAVGSRFSGTLPAVHDGTDEGRRGQLPQIPMSTLLPFSAIVWSNLAAFHINSACGARLSIAIEATPGGSSAVLRRKWHRVGAQRNTASCCHHGRACSRRTLVNGICLCRQRNQPQMQVPDHSTGATLTRYARAKLFAYMHRYSNARTQNFCEEDAATSILHNSQSFTKQKTPLHAQP
jgi:hypothetical protein